MISQIFHLLFFDPLYNLLIVLSGVLPGQSLAAAIILLTLLIKLILLPFQHQALKIQKKLKLLEPELATIKKETEKDKAEQARQTMELYRAHGINPLTTFWTILVQIPIILALYWVFRDSATIHPDLLYSFVDPPAVISINWLGLVDLTKPFFLLSLLVSISQFFQLSLALPSKQPVKLGDSRALAQNLQRQMRYVLPVFILFVASTLPSAIALYWLTSNLFAIGHEYFVRREARSLSPAQPARK